MSYIEEMRKFIGHAPMLSAGATVVALFIAKNVTGDLKITDGESFDLKYFSKAELPALESRASVILDWLIDNRYIL